MAPGRSRSSVSAWATAVPNVVSHDVGASARYASPRARLRRNAFCDAARDSGPIVVYWWFQSTDNPSSRHSSSNARSSSAVNREHNSVKFLRDTAACAPGSKFGSYGSVGSHVTLKKFCTRRSVGRPLSSHPMG
jgi:hypothetical protein